MAKRSRFVKSHDARITGIRVVFETWLKEEGYRNSPTLSVAGIEAPELLEAFLTDLDEQPGKKELLALRRHAKQIGLVMLGTDFFDGEFAGDDEVLDDED
jgi:hypothetical protein